MTVSVVQTANAAGAGSPTTVNFASNATVGNSVIVWIGDYNTSGSVISSSAPTYNGSPVTGAVKLTDVQDSGTSNIMYFAVWLLPDIQSAGKAVAISTTNTRADSSSHYYIAEVAGLGASPAADSASPNPKTASSAAGGAITTGATGTAAGSSGIVLGGMMQDGVTGWTGPAGWTTLATSTLTGASYQIFGSSGSAYTWSSTGASAGQWAAGAVILDAAAGGTPHTATASLTVTPSFTANRTRAHFRAASLTVTPGFTANRTRGHSRAGSLTVTPSFTADRTRGHSRTAALTVTPSLAAVKTGAHPRTGSLTVPPGFTADRARAAFRAASLTVTPSFTAARTRGHSRLASLTVTPSLSATRVRGHSRTASLQAVPSFTTASVHGHARNAILTVTPALRAVAAGGSVVPAVVFAYGTPYFEWEYGTPCFEWATGDPYLS